MRKCNGFRLDHLLLEELQFCAGGVQCLTLKMSQLTRHLSRFAHRCASPNVATRALPWLGSHPSFMFRGHFASKFSGSGIKNHLRTSVFSIHPISRRLCPPIPARQFRAAPSPRIPLGVFPMLKLAKVWNSLFSRHINPLVNLPNFVSYFCFCSSHSVRGTRCPWPGHPRLKARGSANASAKASSA